MLRFAVVLGFAALTVVPAQAAPITYNWVGTVTEVDQPDPAFAVGGRIAITLTLDGDAVDRDPSPNFGNYNWFPGPFDSGPPILNLDIGGTGGGGCCFINTVEIYNDVDGFDRIVIASASTHFGTTGALEFRTTDLDTLTSDAIPLSIDPDDFEVATFARLLSYPIFARGTIDELASAVPEPASITLFGAALLGLVLLTRRWRRKVEPPFIAD
jgi:hypothetical protein